MSYIFYIIYSESADKYYIGHSNDIGERLKKHNSNHSGFKGKQNDSEIVYSEQYSSKSEAYKRESEAKRKKSRKYIEELIGKNKNFSD